MQASFMNYMKIPDELNNNNIKEFGEYNALICVMKIAQFINMWNVTFNYSCG